MKSIKLILLVLVIAFSAFADENNELGEEFIQNWPTQDVEAQLRYLDEYRDRINAEYAGEEQELQEKLAVLRQIEHNLNNNRERIDQIRTEIERLQAQNSAFMSASNRRTRQMEEDIAEATGTDVDRPMTPEQELAQRINPNSSRWSYTHAIAKMHEDRYFWNRKVIQLSLLAIDYEGAFLFAQDNNRRLAIGLTVSGRIVFGLAQSAAGSEEETARVEQDLEENGYFTFNISALIGPTFRVLGERGHTVFAITIGARAEIDSNHLADPVSGEARLNFFFDGKGIVIGVRSNFDSEIAGYLGIQLNFDSIEL